MRFRPLYALIWSLKVGFWLQKRHPFHHFHPHNTLKTPLLSTVGEMGRRIKDKQGLEDESRDQIEHKLSFSSLLFSFHSLVSFNLEMFSLFIPSVCE